MRTRDLSLHVYRIGIDSNQYTVFQEGEIYDSLMENKDLRLEHITTYPSLSETQRDKLCEFVNHFVGPQEELLVKIKETIIK